MGSGWGGRRDRGGGWARAILRRLVLVAGGMLAALLVLELGVRVAGVAPPVRPTGEGDDTEPAKDPVLRFVNKPGGRRTLTYVRRPGGEVFTVTHGVNALGLRGPETTLAKPPGVRRIATLGDSFTFGYGVDDDETWPAALQRALDGTGGAGGADGSTDGATDGAPRYEVLNCGVPAYDTEQEVRLLATRVLAFEPDLVLVAWYLNDPAVRDGAAGTAAQPPPAIVRWTAPGQQGLLPTLRGWSQALDVLCDRLYRRAYQDFQPGAFARLYDDVHPGWRRAKLALQRAQVICRNRGIGFAVVMYPDLSRRGEHLASHEAYRAVEAFCREQGVPCLDLEPAFLGRDLPALRVHPLDSHPNARAHAIAGDAIAAWLRERELLPR
jgi:lysophospholipase L1-like esterase